MILAFRTAQDVEAAIPVAVRHLKSERLLAYPTETVYGLGSIATEPALSALARLKGRPPSKPFLVLVSSRDMAEKSGLVFSHAASVLAEEFWPGPLTLVLPGGEGRLPDTLRGPERGIAVRLTSHAGIHRLITALGEPLTSTSANRPGERPAPGADRIAVAFGPEIARGDLLVLDGGVLGNVPPSTLVDLTAPLPRLIREGAIPRAELRRRAGRLAP
ncbi:MAG: threonylcarbamoyl-AMP synthase [Gemmatimonadales bacterium]|nr:threonylcarbamoyl-AMP synthase [Gemmatimonadales bacterium]